jgi:hypothetical protein
MILEPAGYVALSCPTGPNCYDIIDLPSGTVVVKDVEGLVGGSEATHKQTGTCDAHGYTYELPPRIHELPDVPPLPPVAGCPVMTLDEYAAASARLASEWVDSGKSVLRGICAVVTYDSGDELMQECMYPDGNTGGLSGGLTMMPKGGVLSCEDIWYKNTCPTLKPGDPGYDKCGFAPPPTTPSEPAEQPSELPDMDIWRGPESAPGPGPAPKPTPTPPLVTVIIPLPSPAPSPCDAGTWLRSRPAPTLGRVTLRRGLF